MFTAEGRSLIRDQIIEMGRKDRRLVSGAVVGSTASGEDRWSDLDITFGIEDGVKMADILADWTALAQSKFDAVHLFDLPYQSTVYRVFLLPGNLQVDLSFTPKADFGSHSPRFRLLWGTAIEQPPTQAQSPQELFGLAVLYLLRARICIERGRLWEAEYLISAARDHALSLACLHRGVRASYGKGFDKLPADVLEPFNAALVRLVDRHSLLEALNKTLEGLLANSQDAGAVAARLEEQLRELKSEELV